MPSNASPTATYWGYTLNNYTESELVLVHNATTIDPIVEHVHTLEKGGEEGTNHVQGWLRCSRQVRRSHLQKHWLPRAHFTALSSDEYKANMRNYVQKQDATAISDTRQVRRVEPIIYPALVPELLVKWIRDNTVEHWDPPTSDTVWFWTRDWDPTLTATALDCARLVKELKQHQDEWRWRNVDIALATRETPLELVVEVAKRALIRTHRVETLVDRPEMTRAVRSYYAEILARIAHNSENGSTEEAHGPEAAGGGSPPSSDSSPPDSPRSTG